MNKGDGKRTSPRAITTAALRINKRNFARRSAGVGPKLPFGPKRTEDGCSDLLSLPQTTRGGKFARPCDDRRKSRSLAGAPGRNGARALIGELLVAEERPEPEYLKRRKLPFPLKPASLPLAGIPNRAGTNSLNSWE